MDKILKDHAGKPWEEILASVPRSQLFPPSDPVGNATQLDAANLFRFGTYPMQAGPHMILCLHCKEVVMRDACVDQHCLLCAHQRFGSEGLRARASKASPLLRDALLTPNLESTGDTPQPSRAVTDDGMDAVNGATPTSSGMLRRSSRISQNPPAIPLQNVSSR